MIQFSTRENGCWRTRVLPSQISRSVLDHCTTCWSCWTCTKCCQIFSLGLTLHGSPLFFPPKDRLGGLSRICNDLWYLNIIVSLRGLYDAVRNLHPLRSTTRNSSSCNRKTAQKLMNFSRMYWRTNKYKTFRQFHFQQVDNFTPDLTPFYLFTFSFLQAQWKIACSNCCAWDLRTHK